MQKYLFIILFIVGCEESTNPDTSSNEDGDGTNVGMCECNCAETTYVEVCEEEYVCNTVTTWVQLGSDSYCEFGGCNAYASCSSSMDCHSGSNIQLGCDNYIMCITTEQQSEQVCDYQDVCEDIEVECEQNCSEVDACGNCEGDCVTDEEGFITCSTNSKNRLNADCTGICGGSAIEDCLGNCNGDAILDCNGDCNGNSAYDNCGMCDTDTTNDCIADCSGAWDGDLTIDECGVCGGDGIADGDCDCDGNELDCYGECGGTAWESDCGCVSVDNSGDDCDDCAGTPNGSAYEDECNVCDADNSNDCVQDCNGDWGGTAWESDCGCVSVDNSGDDCDDCAGVPDGDSEVLTYWLDGDGDGLGAGESSEFCDELVEEGWVLNNNDNDDNCLSNVHDCAGECDGNSADSDNDGICDWNDGDSYATVQIGSQEWMSENLKTTHYRNGDAIPNITNNGDWWSLSTGAYGNPPNSETYGKLYNWYTVDDSRGVCPEGWHVPSDAEYTVLTDFLGGYEAGGKMKGLEHWNSPNDGATNESGFTALPAGSRSFSDGNYISMGDFGYFWTSTGGPGAGDAWRLTLTYYSEGAFRGFYSRKYGYSIRCLKD